MLYRTSPEKVAEYYEKNALNQSSIKVIIREGVQCYLDQAQSLMAQEDQPYYEEKEHFLIGNAVDHFLSFGEQSYLDNYHFINTPKPSPGVMSVIKCMFDRTSVNNGFGVFTALPSLDNFKQELWAACNESNFYPNWKKPINEIDKDSRVNKVLKEENSQKYFEGLVEANGRQILSDTQNQIINQITFNFTSHPRVAPLLQPTTDVDVLFQVAIYFTYAGVFCKALIDEVRVHHGLKRIYPIDFKTHGDYLAKFNQAIRIRRYDIQGAFYTDACDSKQGREIISKLTGKDCSDYTIAPFALIAESTKAPKTPMIFVLTNDLLNIGRNGNGKLGSERLAGYIEGIQKYCLWSDNNFDMDAVIDDVFGKGIVQIMENYEFHKPF